MDMVDEKGGGERESRKIAEEQLRRRKLQSKNNEIKLPRRRVKTQEREGIYSSSAECVFAFDSLCIGLFIPTFC